MELLTRANGRPITWKVVVAIRELSHQFTLIVMLTSVERLYLHILFAIRFGRHI
jgi:hypothetical protein